MEGKRRNETENEHKLERGGDKGTSSGIRGSPESQLPELR